MATTPKDEADWLKLGVVFEHINDAEKKTVSELCDRIGFGRVLQLASELWVERGITLNTRSVGKLVGPHKGCTVPCLCRTLKPPAIDHCDLCCGCGWLTEANRKVADRYHAVIVENEQSYLRLRLP